MQTSKVILSILLLCILYAQPSFASNLPQLDTSKYPRVIFWLFINFSILLIFIKYIIIPKLRSIQNTRASKLIANLEKTLRFDREYNKIIFNINEQKKYVDNHREILWDETNKKANIFINQKNIEFNNLKESQKKVILDKITLYKNNIDNEKKYIIKQSIISMTSNLGFNINSEKIDKYIQKEKL